MATAAPNPDSPIFALIAEHRALMIRLKEVMEDNTPDEVRMHQIADEEISKARPATNAGRAALLRFALARSSDAVWGDEVLRGEKLYPDEGEADRFLSIAWNVIHDLDVAAAWDQHVEICADIANEQWAAAEERLRLAEGRLNALPPDCDSAEEDELDDRRWEAKDALLRMSPTTPAQAVRKLELAIVGGQVMSTVDFPALLADAKRIVGESA